MRRWQAHQGWVTNLSFSRDGRLLASRSPIGQDIQIWNPLTGELVQELAIRDEKYGLSCVFGFAFAPDADLLAVTRHTRVELWETSGWRPLAKAPGRYAVDVAVGPGHYPLLAACASEIVSVWRFEPDVDPQLIPVTHWRVSNFSRMSFNHDSSRIATHTSREVEVRDLPSGRRLRAFAHHKMNSVCPVRFSPDSSRLAFSFTKTIESHPAALEDSNDVIRYIGHTNEVWVVRYTPDGRSLISASSDGTVRVWEAATGLQKQCFEMNVGGLTAADVSPDGTMAAVGGTTGEIVAWDLE